ncbi:MAG: hypothetical protein KF764_22115 [Labilithrix sp.]|nr:hypothetical protein [Labilithrix sp.]
MRSPPHDTRRTVIAACLAAAVHAPLLLVGARALSSGPTASAALRDADDAEGEIELVVLESRDDEALAAAAATPAASLEVGAPAATLREAPGASGHAGASCAGESGPQLETASQAVPDDARTTSAAAPSGSGAPLVLFEPRPIALGIAGGTPNPFAVTDPREGATGTGPRSATPDAPTAGEAKRRAEQALRDGVRARDVDVGLGPEGPVLRALEGAAYAGLAPERGSATFLAIVDASGLVVDLRLVSSSGDERGWSETRARALRALGGAKLALRGARGAELRIAVASDVLLPSGNRPSERVRGSFEESKVELPENVPTGGMTTGVTHTRTLSTFDVTDIGAKPRRIVHARLLSLATL